MSTRSTRNPPLKGYVRNPRRRRMGLDVDLNATPSEILDQEGTSANDPFNGAIAVFSAVPVAPVARAAPVAPVGPVIPVDVDAFDDDVIISSPRTFAEAKNNSQRNNGRLVVVDVESEEQVSRFSSGGRIKRRRISSNETVRTCDLINLEDSCHSMRENVVRVDSPPSMLPPPPPPPTELMFNCPVCMGALVEETTTKCGHIFCKGCIRTAITTQNKCPTCRRKVTMKDIHRVYLPSAS